MEIPRQRPNFVSLYCCCNCDTESLWTATHACWFQWRVFTFRLLTYLSFYLLDLCSWRWQVISTSDWRVMSDMIICMIWLIWWYNIIWLITSKSETLNFDLMIDFTVNCWIKIDHFSFWYHVTVERPFLLTFVIRITVFVKKREKLIPIILHIYAAVESCSTTCYYLKL